MSPGRALLLAEAVLLLLGLLGVLLLRPPLSLFPKVSDLAYALFLFLGLYGVDEALSRRFPKSYREAEELMLEALKALSPKERVALVTFSALGEEVFFRGFLLHFLAGWLGPAEAVLFQALIFALFHPVPKASAWVYPVIAFVAGAAFGLFTLSAGSLYPAILAHLGLNLAALKGSKLPAGGYLLSGGDRRCSRKSRYPSGARRSASKTAS